MIPIDDIRRAAQRIEASIHRTPLMHSGQIGSPTGVELFLKCENFQKTGSFKARGAINKVLTLNETERKAGLITVSAGNHAGAVAWAAQQVGSPCAVVMPSNAPRSKVDAVRGYGAEVIPHDDRATLFDKLAEEQKKRGSTFVHPFDDPVVLAGAGTVGLEIVEALPTLDAVFVPVGGGGLMAGVASAIKQLRPDTRVYAVELESGPGLRPALDAGKPIPVKRSSATLADGMTPPFVGQLPLDIAREVVDEVVAVSEEAIVQALTLLLTRAKLYVEGSGAAATAALLSGKVKLKPGSRVATIVSGGNIDLDAVGRLS